MIESSAGLRTGKVPRKCGLTLQSRAGQFTFNFAAESFVVSGLKLPEIPDAPSARALIEERLTLLRDFCSLLDGLYESFLKVRMNGRWESTAVALRRWIAAGKGAARRELAAV